MPSFSKGSLIQLATCHPDLQRIAYEAIQWFDFTVLEGHRDQAAQDQAVAKGLSKVAWPHGKHNQRPSLAMDCAPYPIDWSDKPKALERFVFMQGIFYAIARRFGIPVRLGIDWNGNEDMRDEGSFRDYPHIELVISSPAPTGAIAGDP